MVEQNDSSSSSSSSSPSNDIVGLSEEILEDSEMKHGVTSDNLTDSDFLIMKRGRSESHIGNTILRSFVSRLAANNHHPTCCRTKRNLVQTVLTTFRESDGRFLKQKGRSYEVWYEIGDQNAIKRILKIFREQQPQSADVTT